jgi:hypothetical protein
VAVRRDHGVTLHGELPPSAIAPALPEACPHARPSSRTPTDTAALR